MMDQDQLFEKLVMQDFEHDRNAPWWVAKRRPINLFEQAPVPCAIFLFVWIIAASIPGIAMVSKTVACAIGVADIFCASQ